MNEIYFVLAGFFVGSIVGLTGVGGGSLMTPLLIFLMGIKPHMAVGTDLLFAAITKSGGTFSLWRQKLIPWRVVARLSMGSLPGCLLTLYVLDALDLESAQVQWIITHTLGLALLLTAASLLYKVFKTTFGAPLSGTPTNTEEPANAFASHANIGISANVALSAEVQDSELEYTKASHPWLTVLLGLVIGAMVTLTSVGAGAIGVSVLMILYPKLPLPRIVAADIAYAVPLTLLAGLGHAGLGTVDWNLLFYLVLGSLPGIWVGSRLLVRAPEKLIRLSLSILLAWAASRLIFA